VALVRSSTPRWLVTAGIALGIWAVALLDAFLGMLPWVPRTRREWGLFIVVAPLAYIVCSWIGERVFSRDLGRCISPKRFSLLRIILALSLMMLLLAPIIWWGLRSAVEP
jgi:hypothetical protein